jgi:hypothetical protein
LCFALRSPGRGAAAAEGASPDSRLTENSQLMAPRAAPLALVFTLAAELAHATEVELLAGNPLFVWAKNWFRSTGPNSFAATAVRPRLKSAAPVGVDCFAAFVAPPAVAAPAGVSEPSDPPLRYRWPTSQLLCDSRRVFWIQFARNLSWH